MSSATANMTSSTLNDETLIQQQRMKGIGYARAAGTGIGLFFIGWAPANMLRWEGQGPTGLLVFEMFFFILYGTLLAMPWSLLKTEKLWKIAFAALIVCSFLFGFIMVIDTLFQHSLATEVEGRPAPPAFPGLQIFFGLMQVPAVLFLRKPDLLD